MKTIYTLQDVDSRVFKSVQNLFSISLEQVVHFGRPTHPNALEVRALVGFIQEGEDLLRAESFPSLSCEDGDEFEPPFLVEVAEEIRDLD